MALEWDAIPTPGNPRWDTPVQIDATKPDWPSVGGYFRVIVNIDDVSVEGDEPTEQQHLDIISLIYDAFENDGFTTINVSRQSGITQTASEV